MTFSILRTSLFSRITSIRCISRGPRPDPNNDQIEYVRSLTQEDIHDWDNVKKFTLENRGNINNKNFNAVVLKALITCKKTDIAASFAEHILSNEKELSLGSINGLLEFYCHLSYYKDLSESEKKFILDSYNHLYDKYKLLDFVTCERLLHGLCAIDEWKKAMKVLEDIKQTGTPSHLSFSSLISTLFKNNKKTAALNVIQDSINNRRPLQHQAYEAWVDYILRKYKDKNTIAKYLNEMTTQIKDSFTIISSETAALLVENYSALGWNAKYTKIKKSNGQCVMCQQVLDSLSATEEEFTYLQQNIRDRLIVRTDLFLKSSPEELQKFQEFLKQSGPFDVVLDSLNIAFAAQGTVAANKLRVLNEVVDHFINLKKHVLVLGRKHMLNWNKYELRKIMQKTSSFFTDDLSQDDPYLITAAILSGPDTDIVSKDLFRGHLFNLKEEKLKNIFRRWQWQHQWMVFVGRGKIHIQAPLNFTPCAQFKNDSWHIPFQSDEPESNSHVNDGIPDMRSWLCLTKR